MPITFSCPECFKAVKVKDELAGKTIKCPACQATINVPAAEGAADNYAVAETAAPARKAR
jgi:hypothetical protein